MIIAFTASSASWNGVFTQHFGRTPLIVLLDEEKSTFTEQSNEKNEDLGHGAGINTAYSVIECGAKMLITKQLGPKAFEVLKNNNIEIYYTNDAKDISEAYHLYKQGLLPAAKSPNR